MNTKEVYILFGMFSSNGKKVATSSLELSDNNGL